MSAGSRRNHPGFVKLYQLSLERQLQRGQWDPVCRDEDLCKVVEGSLSKSGAQEVHSQLEPDALSVIETSLRTLSGRSGPSRLRNLAKAFQVLELAALNLYLCPWRKEYRVVKMFSGMFTHCIKPALTSQQAQELFGLLGYQAGGAGAEEELRLRTKPTGDLLHLACAFFVARLECQLLLSVSSDSAGDGSEWELQLVHERRRGLSLHAAWENVRKKMESAPPQRAPPSSLSNVDTAVDLYTDHSVSEGHRMSSPPSSSYVPPTEEWDGEGRTAKAQEVCVSTAMCRMAPKNKTKADRLVGREPGSHPKRGTQCGETSASLWHCEEQGCGLTSAQQQQQKDVLKQHRCMIKPTEDYFIICHDCHYIHDVGCRDVDECNAQRHNAQLTGKLQPPQIEAPQRHICLETDHAPFLICKTCNQFHDLLCTQKEVCQISDHDLEYLNTPAHGSDVPPTTDFHHCCISTLPEFACSTCGLFHTFSCNDNRCQEKHEVRRLTPECSACSATSDLYITCKYCWAQYCKSCWFKTPLNCKCGKPFHVLRLT